MISLSYYSLIQNSKCEMISIKKPRNVRGLRLLSSKPILTKRPELVCPAGNMNSLRYALEYGADNIYFGGSQFNLRGKTKNEFEHLRKGVELCRQRNIKTTFLLNSFIHESDLHNAKKYLSSIQRENLKFDSVTISDPGMLLLLKDLNYRLTRECSGPLRGVFNLSTQKSTLNHLSVKFWSEQGIRRVILGRELKIEEVEQIVKELSLLDNKCEVEMFVHGSLCMAYSGKCSLSYHLTGNDANKGVCLQPCRWPFSVSMPNNPNIQLDVDLIEDEITDRKHIEIFSSKDLCLIEKLPKIREIGVSGLKVEGRLKSLYYVSNVARIYRHALETIDTDPSLELFKENLPFYLEELDNVPHRAYTKSLIHDGKGDENGSNIKGRKRYVGHYIRMGEAFFHEGNPSGSIKKSDMDEIEQGTSEGSNSAVFRIVSNLKVGDEIEAIYPFTLKDLRLPIGCKDSKVKVVNAYYLDSMGVKRRPEKGILSQWRRWTIEFDKIVFPFAILRRNTNN